MADYKKYEDLVLKNEKLTEEQYAEGQKLAKKLLEESK